MYSWIHRAWYDDAAGAWLLLPLSGLYWLITGMRKLLYRAGWLRQVHMQVPVIVVGNLTAGGTGKTPVTIWLAQELAARGWHPGVVSRGYGGSKSSAPMRVDASSEPFVVGDEPVLIAQKSGCPVVVDSSRVDAAGMLLREGVDVILADDGLQHLKLGRDYEICVVDGARMFGNRWLLPAGPLREPVARLAEVDQVLINGQATGEVPGQALSFSLQPGAARRLNGTLQKPLADFAGRTVHAVAAIGNPGRFFALLRAFDIQVIEHALADHATLDPADSAFADSFEVLMTEKDAVKLGSVQSDRFWYVPVDLCLNADAAAWLDDIEVALRDSPGFRLAAAATRPGEQGTL